MKESLPNRIREFRKARNLSLEELAFRVGEDTSLTTLSKLERGRMELTHRWLERIGQALGVSPLELIADATSQVRLVPVLGSVPAGDLAEAIADPQGWLPVPGNIGGDRAFALKPKGDSMDQLVEEGGYIVVDPDELDLIPGRAYVVTTSDGQSTFKRYRPDPPRLEPDSSNPEHQPIFVGREPFVIAGRVIYAAHEL